MGEKDHVSGPGGLANLFGIGQREREGLGVMAVERDENAGDLGHRGRGKV